MEPLCLYNVLQSPVGISHDPVGGGQGKKQRAAADAAIARCVWIEE